MPLGQHRYHKSEAAQTAARLDGDQPQPAVVQARARSQLPQQAAERPYPHRQNLRHLLLPPLIAPGAEYLRTEEPERENGPDADHLKKIQRVSESPLQLRIGPRQVG